jgi:hypothetical protein
VVYKTLLLKLLQEFNFSFFSNVNFIFKHFFANIQVLYFFKKRQDYRLTKKFGDKMKSQLAG